MKIEKFQKEHLLEVVSMWNIAALAQEKSVGQNTRQRAFCCSDPDTLSSDELLEVIESDDFLSLSAAVSLHQGKVVGFAHAGIQRNPTYIKDEIRAKPSQLSRIAVHPDYWREGIGRALLCEVELSIRKAGESVIDFCPHRIDIDTGPYHFLLACGYRPMAHNLCFHHDLSRFQLSEDIANLQSRLEGEGIEFRWHKPADTDSFLSLLTCYFPFWYDGTSNSGIKEDVDLNGPIMLALACDKIVGFIGGIWPGWGESGTFSSPGVAPEFRQRGIGTVLTYLALDYLKRNQTTDTFYCTHADNPAQYMYFRAGAELAYICCRWFRKVFT